MAWYNGKTHCECRIKVRVRLSPEQKLNTMKITRAEFRWIETMTSNIELFNKKKKKNLSWEVKFWLDETKNMIVHENLILINQLWGNKNHMKFQEFKALFGCQRERIEGKESIN